MQDRLTTSTPSTTQASRERIPSHTAPVEREGAWAAPGTRTRSSWGTVPEARAGNVFRCSLSGEIDFSHRDELLAVAREFETSGRTSAEVDVSDVSFVDSTALAMLLAMRRTAGERGGSVKLVRPGRRLRRLLTLAGVAELFSVDGGPSG